MNDPADLIDGISDAGDVSKAETVAEFKASVRWFANAEAISEIDLSGRDRIMVGDNLYKKNAGSVAAPNGFSVLLDQKGNVWTIITFSGIPIDAVGPFSGRPSYNAQTQGFAYLSENGDGGSYALPVIFIKASNVSGDWSDPIPTTGPQGPMGQPGASYAGTSASSVAIGNTGTKTFTTQAGLAYVAGSRVRVSTGANWMEGVVSSYLGTTLSFTADLSNGAGTFTNWTLSLAGEPGQDGDGAGDVIGPESSAAGRIATFQNTTGKRIQDSGVEISTEGTMASNSDAKVPTEKAVRTFVAAAFDAIDAFQFKGFLDCSTNPNYPAASAGHVYRVSVAGKIGGASGPNVEQNDILTCIVDGVSAGNHATVGSSWVITQANIDGAVTLTGTQTLSNKTLASTTVFPNTVAPATGGVITDSGLPARLRGNCVSVSDWNNANESGWYRGASAANGPTVSNYVGNVIQWGDAGWCTQIVHEIASDGPSDTKTWRREQNNGVWGSWYRLRYSQDELDARYSTGGGGTGSGLPIVRAVMVDNVDISTGLDNGSVVGGVTLATGNLVLLVGQDDAEDNGLYVVAASGAASRSTDFDQYNDHPGVVFSVLEGDKANTLWLCTSDLGGTLGTTAITIIPLVGTFLQAFSFQLSDDVTALTAGAAKITYRWPYPFRPVDARASLTVAQTSGAVVTIDINRTGTSILSTKLTIDNGEKTSTTATTPRVLTNAVFADDEQITIDVDGIGDGTAKGLKVTILGYQLAVATPPDEPEEPDPVETPVNTGTGTPYGNMTVFGLANAFNGVTSAAGGSCAAISASAAGYVGISFGAAKLFSKVRIYGANDRGFIDSANPSVTINIYGKNGAPSSQTDGTLLGTLTFTDTDNESAGREITLNTSLGTFTHLHAHINGGAASTFCAELQAWELI